MADPGFPHTATRTLGCTIWAWLDYAYYDGLLAFAQGCYSGQGPVRWMGTELEAVPRVSVDPAAPRTAPEQRKFSPKQERTEVSSACELVELPSSWFSGLFPCGYCGHRWCLLPAVQRG